MECNSTGLIDLNLPLSSSLCMQAGVYVLTKESAIVLFPAGNVDFWYSGNWKFIERTGSVFCFDSVQYSDASDQAILLYFDLYHGTKSGVSQ